jgi:hypothetical protein
MFRRLLIPNEYKGFCLARELGEFDLFALERHDLGPIVSRKLHSGDGPPHMLRTGRAIIRSDKSVASPDRLLLVDVRPRLTQHGTPTKTAI